MRPSPDTPGIGPVMGMALVATTMIGSGVFLLPATLATVGTISLLGWLLAAAGALLIGITLGLLSRISPGSFLDSIGFVFGPLAGQASALLYVAAYPLVLAAVALAASGNIGFIVPGLAGQPESSWVAVGFIALMVLLTHFGARQVARFGSLTLMLGLIPLLLVATAGWAHFDAETFRAGWNMSGGSASSALFQATLLCFWAFLGLESASIISRQMRDPETSVLIATVGGILLAMLVYVAATTAISGMIPAAALARSTAPFADATVLIIGPMAAILVAVVAAAKALGTLGATQLGGTECWLCVQRQFKLTGISFSVANPILGALAAAVVWATASPTLASQYGQIIGAVVVVTLLVYGLAGIALAVARSGAARFIGLAAAAFSFGLIVTQPAETLLLAAACIIAALVPALLSILNQKRKAIPSA
jgi:arginine:agmatine antiporter